MTNKMEIYKNLWNSKTGKLHRIAQKLQQKAERKRKSVMYRSRHNRQQEKIATAFLWLLALVCAFYISWKINPYPLKQGVNWVENQTEQFFDRCMEQAFAQTLPALSNFFFQDTEFAFDLSNNFDNSDTTILTIDPFYLNYQSFSQPGDG